LVLLITTAGCGASAGSVLKPIVHVSCEVARAAVRYCPAVEAATSSVP